MAKQTQKTVVKTRQQEAPPEEKVSEESKETAAEKRERLTAEMDELLEEIDDVLSDEEAQVFLREYVQKGGQ